MPTAAPVTPLEGFHRVLSAVNALENCPAWSEYYLPKLDALAKHDAAALEIELQRYLNSDPINMRTDDDKTLLLALRVNGGGEPSAN